MAADTATMKPASESAITSSRCVLPGGRSRQPPVWAFFVLARGVPRVVESKERQMPARVAARPRS